MSYQDPQLTYFDSRVSSPNCAKIRCDLSYDRAVEGGSSLLFSGSCGMSEYVYLSFFFLLYLFAHFFPLLFCCIASFSFISISLSLSLSLSLSSPTGSLRSVSGPPSFVSSLGLTPVSTLLSLSQLSLLRLFTKSSTSSSVCLCQGRRLCLLRKNPPRT
jgi:hypothetical protein